MFRFYEWWWWRWSMGEMFAIIASWPASQPAIWNGKESSIVFLFFFFFEWFFYAFCEYVHSKSSKMFHRRQKIPRKIITLYVHIWWREKMPVDGWAKEQEHRRWAWMHLKKCFFRCFIFPMTWWWVSVHNMLYFLNAKSSTHRIERLFQKI